MKGKKVCVIGVMICALFFGSLPVHGYSFLTCFHFEERGFLRAIEAARIYEIDGRILGAAVPHFLPVMSFTASLLKTVAAQEEESGQKIETVFLFGPNHSGEGLPIILTDHGWLTPFGPIKPDLDAVMAIEAAGGLGVRLNTDIIHLEQDHALATLVPFIKYYLPNVRVVTIMFSRGFGLRELLTLAEIIYGISQSRNVLLLASVDFSHYLDINETPLRDAFTDKIIRSYNFEVLKGLDSGYLDSPESMILLMAYALNFTHEILLLDSIIMPESDILYNIGYSYHVYAFVLR